MEENYSGSIRIKKASTLQSWIDKGWYKDSIDRGFTFAVGCGRFVSNPCKCSKCRRPNSGKERRRVLEINMKHGNI